MTPHKEHCVGTTETIQLSVQKGHDNEKGVKNQSYLKERN